MEEAKVNPKEDSNDDKLPSKDAYQWSFLKRCVDQWNPLEDMWIDDPIIEIELKEDPADEYDMENDPKDLAWTIDAIIWRWLGGFYRRTGDEIDYIEDPIKAYPIRDLV